MDNSFNFNFSILNFQHSWIEQFGFRSKVQEKKYNSDD